MPTITNGLEHIKSPRDYGIHISVGRVYRLMKSLQLPKMSTEKPFHPRKHNENGHCTNHLSKKGYPFDNACCECFFKYLKKEEVNRKTYHSLQELQLSVFEYIEGFYNAKRPHSSLGMMTPNEKEEWYWAQL